MQDKPTQVNTGGEKKPHGNKHFRYNHHKKHYNKAENDVKLQQKKENELEESSVISENEEFTPYEEMPATDVGLQSSFSESAEEKSTEKVEIIGVRFKESGKIYYFAPSGLKIEKDTPVIVETARGIEYSFVAVPNSFVPASTVVQPLKPIVRIATEDDKRRYENNKRLEKDAAAICEKKIAEHGLEMKLIDVEYTFDNNKLIFYFTADGRVDFRELVKDLANVFKTRIELRQIGIRDEAKLLGGLGICGRVFCCNSFLSDFAQVSIKMAKDQNLSLNSSKISGTCGRLICCLKYENDIYEEEIKKTPPVDSIVKCADGDEGVVIDTNPLAGLLKIRLNNRTDTVIKLVPREDVEVIGKMKKGEAKMNELIAPQS